MRTSTPTAVAAEMLDITVDCSLGNHTMQEGERLVLAHFYYSVGKHEMQPAEQLLTLSTYKTMCSMLLTEIEYVEAQKAGTVTETVRH